MIGMNIKESIAGSFRGFLSFLQQCKRVLLIASKQGKDELNLSIKVTGLGILVIGLLGFVLFMIFQLLGFN
jgi:protein transport protein SEC61 subunit gamma-like protein